MYVTLKNNLDLEPATTGPTAPLWGKFYLHINTSISALNDDIQQSFPNILSIFSSMAHLMSADVSFSNRLPQAVYFSWCCGAYIGDDIHDCLHDAC